MGTQKVNFGVGHALLKTDGATPQSQTLQAIQSVTIEFSGNIESLFGQGKYALDKALSSVDTTGSITVGKSNLQLYNRMFFGESEQTTGAIYKKFSDQDSSEGEVTLADISDMEDAGAYLPDGTPLVRVESTPDEGEYSVDEATGMYTFNTSTPPDTVDIIVLDTVTDVESVSIQNEKAGNAPRFKFVYYGEYRGRKCTMVLNSCIGTGISPVNSENQSHETWEIGFEFERDSNDEIGSITFH